MSENGQTEQPQPRRSYRQGDALRDALAALGVRAARPMVSISRDTAGHYSFDVRVTHDDADQALDIARDIAAKLDADYPAHEPAPERHKVGLTRNAKGETQIDLDGKWTTSADLEEVAAQYEALRARYPLADGTATKDAPKGKS